MSDLKLEFPSCVSPIPEIKTIDQKRLIGFSIQTCLVKRNDTFDLWHRFKKKCAYTIENEKIGFYSVQQYPENLDFKTFTENTEFMKWAAMEEKDFKGDFKELETYTLDGGLYAIFNHSGPASDFYKTTAYIFGRWLPNSIYALDNRNHFEFMPPDYKGFDHPEAKEEVWIPITEKN